MATFRAATLFADHKRNARNTYLVSLVALVTGVLEVHRKVDAKATPSKVVVGSGQGRWAGYHDRSGAMVFCANLAHAVEVTEPSAGMALSLSLAPAPLEVAVS